ncbi:hypothetical protein GCM10020001_088830 [Nonomuraea salmonea]
MDTRITASEAVVAATSFAQFALVALAMLTVTSEYASGGIRVTLQATPVRGMVLAAKALVVAPVMVLAGVLTGGRSPRQPCTPCCRSTCSAGSSCCRLARSPGTCWPRAATTRSSAC